MKAAALVCAKEGLEPLTPERLDVRVLKLYFFIDLCSVDWKGFGFLTAHLPVLKIFPLN